MTEEEFTLLSIENKWEHLKRTMDYIVKMDSQYTGRNTAFELRRRYNPHHPAEQVKEETRLFKQEQKELLRNLRMDQYQRWAHVKSLYSTSRDELANTLGNSEYEECKSIMERIFTMEVDDALRDILED